VIVALSQALEDDLRAQEKVRAHILQIPNGVDTALFHPASPDERARARKSLGLPDEALVIASVAMLYPRKNVVAIVRAVARMTARPVCIAMAGPPGPDPAYLEELDAAIAALPEGATARRLGALEPDRLADLALAADLFVLVSRAEGLPNALLEAMSAGLACVASDIPGAADVLEDGGGVLVPLDDDAALAETLDRLASDPGERGRLGAEARKLVEDRYSFSSVASRYRAVYDSMLERADRS
jgi:glycosyltransferase involved in cell wall biosynthesis